MNEDEFLRELKTLNAGQLLYIGKAAGVLLLRVTARQVLTWMNGGNPNVQQPYIRQCKFIMKAVGDELTLRSENQNKDVT